MDATTRVILCIVSLHYLTMGTWIYVQWHRERRREREERERYQQFTEAFLEKLATMRMCVLRDYIEREEPPPSKTVGFQVPR